MRLGRKATLFCAGGAIYVTLELLWRGRSHSSMFLAGGCGFLLLGALGRFIKSPIMRAISGSGIITIIEFVSGLLFNRNYSVWDYRDVSCNLNGQICLPFCLLWMPVSLLGMWFYEKVDLFLPGNTKKTLDK